MGAVLKAQGYDVIPQVGVSGYYIDLAVRHPKKPGASLLGIEFDGKSYHSGRSARDRDRLRQMTLENQSWKIHRIWSTDWFKIAIQKLNGCCIACGHWKLSVRFDLPSLSEANTKILSRLFASAVLGSLLDR